MGYGPSRLYFVSQDLKTSQETPTVTIELPEKMYLTIWYSMYGKIPNDT